MTASNALTWVCVGGSAAAYAAYIRFISKVSDKTDAPAAAVRLQLVALAVGALWWVGFWLREKRMPAIEPRDAPSAWMAGAFVACAEVLAFIAYTRGLSRDEGAAWIYGGSFVALVLLWTVFDRNVEPRQWLGCLAIGFGAWLVMTPAAKP